MKENTSEVLLLALFMVLLTLVLASASDQKDFDARETGDTMLTKWRRIYDSLFKEGLTIERT